MQKKRCRARPQVMLDFSNANLILQLRRCGDINQQTLVNYNAFDAFSRLRRNCHRPAIAVKYNTKGLANKCSPILVFGLCFRAGHQVPYSFDLKYISLPFLEFEQCFGRGVILSDACYLNWVQGFLTALIYVNINLSLSVYMYICMYDM